MSSQACRVVLAVSLFFLGSVAKASAATILSGCTDIRNSGFYTLDRDITGTVGSACVQIRDVSDVHLNCQGHSITTDDSSLAALLVQAAKNFSITGCKLPQYSGYSLFVGNSLNGTINKNFLKDMVVFETNPLAAASIQLTENKFSEFRGDSLHDSLIDGDTGVIPVAAGVTQILARNLVAPTVANVPGDPSTRVATNPMHVRAYPSPWYGDRHGQFPITFDGLPPNTTIKIFTVSARWVRTLSSPATTLTWDLRNAGGEPVASGIYLYTATTDQGQKTVGKLTVIR